MGSWNRKGTKFRTLEDDIIKNLRIDEFCLAEPSIVIWLFWGVFLCWDSFLYIKVLSFCWNRFLSPTLLPLFAQFIYPINLCFLCLSRILKFDLSTFIFVSEICLVSFGYYWNKSGFWSIVILIISIIISDLPLCWLVQKYFIGVRF